MNDINIKILWKKVFIYQECNFGSSKDVIPETVCPNTLTLGIHCLSISMALHSGPLDSSHYISEKV